VYLRRMRTVTTREHQLLEKLVRRIDRKLSFEAIHRDDGDIELRLNAGRLNTLTQLGPAALEASSTDALQFEALRGKIKRVSDRMRMPAPPPKVPKVEIQKDAAYSFRPGGRGRGRR